MKINIWPIVSSLHNKVNINKETLTLIESIKDILKCEINIVSIKYLYDADISLILVQSGGSENEFILNYKDLKPPYYILTYGTNNSLAASLEILSYLKDNSLDGEVLHGSSKYIASRIKEIYKNKNKIFDYDNLGVIGMPSNWLIASKVNPDDAKKYHNINLEYIPISEVKKEYNKLINKNYESDFKYDKEELNKALRVDEALNLIIKRYNLKGITIRCFDLLNTLKTTSCLSLALLNSKGIIGSCEGDIPAFVSMYIVKKLFNQSSFQANPSQIDIEKKEVLFAHCTIPFDMIEKYYLTTHFESNSGVAIKGYLKEDKVTIFKLSKNLKNYYVDTGVILKNLEKNNLCRTQIVIKFDNDIDYFLKRPYGNHHIIILGDKKKEIEEYMSKIKKS